MERLPLRPEEFRRHAPLAQCREIIDRARHVGPEFACELPVAGKPEMLRDRVGELAVAVVLGQPVGNILVHGTRHVAVGGLVQCVPAQVVAHYVIATQT